MDEGKGVADEIDVHGTKRNAQGDEREGDGTKRSFAAAWPRGGEDMNCGVVVGHTCSADST